MTARLHLVRLDDVTPQPWKNGGGVTRELAAWPAAEGWDVRVSVATVERAGPFSAFPGVVRWFSVLDGEGVRLLLPDGETTMTPADPPIRFDGETAPGCALIGGETRDLNLMARRGAGTVRMELARNGSRLEGATRWRGMFTEASVLLEADGATELVPNWTLAWSDEQAPARWTVRTRGAGRVWWLVLEAPGQAPSADQESTGRRRRGTKPRSA